MKFKKLKIKLLDQLIILFFYYVYYLCCKCVFSFALIFETVVDILLDRKLYFNCNRFPADAKLKMWPTNQNKYSPSDILSDLGISYSK